MTRMLAGVRLSLVLAFSAQPAEGPGGGDCSGQSSSSQSSALNASPYTQKGLSLYTQNSLAKGYALQQMQQQYFQQAMVARQIMAQVQMENQRLQAQLMQMQNQASLAAANANGDSNQLLTAMKDSKALNAKPDVAKKKPAAVREPLLSRPPTRRTKSNWQSSNSELDISGRKP